MMRQQEDRELLAQWAGQEDGEAFAELCRRYARLVYATCLRVLKDPGKAEDTAQESLLEFAQRAGSIDASIPGWLHTVATRRALNRARSEARRLRRERAYAQEADTAVEPEWSDIGGLIDEAVADLPARHRDVIIDRFFEGRTQQELAARHGLSRGQVRSRLDKGLTLLRRRLKRQGVVVSGAALVTLFEAHLAEATAVPASLTVGVGNAVASGAVSPTVLGAASIAGGLGALVGVLTMKRLIAALALVCAAASAAYVVYRANAGSRQDGEPVARTITPDGGGVYVPVESAAGGDTSEAADSADKARKPANGEPNDVAGDVGRAEQPTAEEWAEVLKEASSDVTDEPSDEEEAGAAGGEFGALRGTVTVGGVPSPRTPIVVRDSVNRGDLSAGYADESGYYELGRVPVGEVLVHAELDIAGSGFRRRWRIAVVEPGLTTQVDFPFPAETGALQGAVTLMGKPPAKLWVTGWAHGQAAIERWSADVNTDGSYEVRSLPEGTLKLMAQAFDADGAKFVRHVQIDIKAGETTTWDHDFTLGAVLTGNIQGIIPGANNGIAVFEGHVDVPTRDELSPELFYQLQNTMTANIYIRDMNPNVTISGDSASFVSEELSPGHYTLIAYSVPGQARQAAAFREAKVAAHEVVIEEDRPVHLEFVLK